MQQYDFPYTELRANSKTMQAQSVELVRTFYAASIAKDMKLGQYQKMLLAVVDMPLFARVLCGFVDKKSVLADFAEDRFNFHQCNEKDLLILYDCIEKFFVTVFFTKANEAEKKPITANDLLFLREYLTSNNCENFSFYYFSNLFEIIANTFLAVSDKQFYEDGNIKGKNIFEVGGKLFYLPVKAIQDLIAQQSANFVLSKNQLESTVIENLGSGQYKPYSTWNATTAIEFFRLSQDFSIIHQGVQINQAELNENNKIAFENSVAAIFAALSREIDYIDADTNKIYLVAESSEKTIQEMESDTIKKIDFFNTHLTMDEAHQCSFFFANTITPTNNILALHTKSHHPKNKLAQTSKKKK